jgi:site-specific DNA-adenine methylase
MNNCLHFYKPIDRKQVLGAREVLFKTMHHILNSELTNEIKDEIIAMYNIVINNIDKVTEKQYWKNKQQFKGGAK